MKFGSLVKRLAEQTRKFEFRGCCKTTGKEKKKILLVIDRRNYFFPSCFQGHFYRYDLIVAKKRNCPFILFLSFFYSSSSTKTKVLQLKCTLSLSFYVFVSKCYLKIVIFSKIQSVEPTRDSF